MKSKLISGAGLTAVVAELSMSATDSKALAKKVAAYLITNSYEARLGSLMRDVLAYRQARGIVEANIITARPLGDEVDARLALFVKSIYPNSKTVIVRESQDKSVVGGFKLRFANEQLDMSIRSRLDKFRQLIAGGRI